MFLNSRKTSPAMERADFVFCGFNFFGSFDSCLIQKQTALADLPNRPLDCLLK
jgi:hypothetical protein